MSHLLTTIKHIMSRISGSRTDSVNSTTPENVYPYSLTLSEEPIPANREDQKFLTALQRLDLFVEEGADYTEWEPHFFSMQKLCCTRYAQWLKAKGVSKELSQEFPLCLEVYLACVYQHGTGELKQVSSRTLKEFLMNFLPHKVMVDPAEYISWLPALKLFYMFLGEKGCLNDSAAMMKNFAKVEPGFLRFAKKLS